MGNIRIAIYYFPLFCAKYTPSVVDDANICGYLHFVLGSRYSDSLRAGRSGDRIPGGGGGEIFRTRSDRPCDPPSLLHNGYRVFPAGKAAGAWC